MAFLTALGDNVPFAANIGVALAADEFLDRVQDGLAVLMAKKEPEPILAEKIAGLISKSLEAFAIDESYFAVRIQGDQDDRDEVKEMLCPLAHDR